MKTIVRALLLALPLSLCAAPSDSILLIGKSVRTDKVGTVFSGSVSVFSKANPERIGVTADEIVLDQCAGASVLKCSGNATIQIGSRTVRGQNLTFEFADLSGNIYVLNQNGIVIGATAAIQTGEFYVRAGTPAPDSVELRGKILSGDTVFHGRTMPGELEATAVKKGDQPLPKFDMKPELLPAKP